jgi:hypothetical protein
MPEIDSYFEHQDGGEDQRDHAGAERCPSKKAQTARQGTVAHEILDRLHKQGRRESNQTSKQIGVKPTAWTQQTGYKRSDQAQVLAAE